MIKASASLSVEESARQKLIVALDVSSLAAARRLISELHGIAGMFKVGSELFTSAGPDVVRELVAEGERVFLDLKFHDIPNTVAAAAVAATRLGVTIFNVHASGGREMMMRTVEAVSDTAAKEALPRPAVIAVTVLTSCDRATLAEVGVSAGPPEQVQKLALLAATAGLDGVVASPQEVKLVRAAVPKDDFLLVTPGVRPAGSASDDQRRITTPRAAIAAGADYLVVGRPITASEKPTSSANAIIQEIAQALREMMPN